MSKAPRSNRHESFTAHNQLKTAGHHALEKTHINVRTLEQFGNAWLGLNLQVEHLKFYQLLFRSLIVFFALLLMIRLAGRRFLAKHSALDVLLTFLLASLLSRAINGNAPFLFTLGTGFCLAALYRGLAYVACRFHCVGRWLKGVPEPVVENGRILKNTLKHHRISEHDLMEDLRLNGNVNDLAEVKLAQLERNGSISVIKNHDQ